MTDEISEQPKEDIAQEPRPSGLIEGGIDAIVIGAGVDGLAAAAYLGKAGLHTILVGDGADLGGPIAEREILPGVMISDGEHLVTQLDPDVIAELDLYRHGLSFSARRLDTSYFFDDFETLKVEGDLSRAACTLGEGEEREGIEAFLIELLTLSSLLRPAFRPLTRAGQTDARRVLEKAMKSASPRETRLLQTFLFSSAAEVLSARFPDGPLRTLFYSETAFRSSASPHEDFSFMSYLRRLSGEAVGLQAAAAYPEGGMVSLVNALRRAAQSAKVDMRATAHVKSILIEGDEVAGVMLEDGGQLRAPIVVASSDARKTFLDLIGPDAIDIELQRLLTAPPPAIGTARVQIVLKGVAQDELTRSHMQRRLFYSPSVEEVNAAFLDARKGRVPEKLIVEALFPCTLDDSITLDSRQLISIMAHPIPFKADQDDALKAEVSKAVLASMEAFAGDLSDRIEAIDIQTPADQAARTGANAAAFAARPDMIRQWAIAGAASGAGRITGLYFCGPEAQTGAGVSCVAARAAARAALRAYRKGRA